MSRIALADTGFWISLLDSKSDVVQHQEAVSFFNLAVESQIPILKPWPCLYEVFRTKGIKSQSFKNSRYLKFVLDSNGAIDDSDYRASALHVLETQMRQHPESGKPHPSLSLVDIVINKMLEANPGKVKYFITNNLADFRSTVTQLKGLEVIDLRPSK